MNQNLKPCSGCDCESPCANIYVATIAKVNETKCRECGGKGSPSKGIVNTHHIQRSYLRGQDEFTTTMEDCLKCGDCGHSWN